uniref:Uncharacterized protein n=1 Tax=Arundo donax TaxID=35708 RepID=A0A0A9A2D6_ARUDO
MQGDAKDAEQQGGSKAGAEVPARHSPCNGPPHRAPDRHWRPQLRRGVQIRTRPRTQKVG